MGAGAMGAGAGVAETGNVESVPNVDSSASDMGRNWPFWPSWPSSTGVPSSRRPLRLRRRRGRPSSLRSLSAAGSRTGAADISGSDCWSELSGRGSRGLRPSRLRGSLGSRGSLASRDSLGSRGSLASRGSRPSRSGLLSRPRAGRSDRSPLASVRSALRSPLRPWPRRPLPRLAS